MGGLTSPPALLTSGTRERSGADSPSGACTPTASALALAERGCPNQNNTGSRTAPSGGDFSHVPRCSSVCAGRLASRSSSDTPPRRGLSASPAGPHGSRLHSVARCSNGRQAALQDDGEAFHDRRPHMVTGATSDQQAAIANAQDAGVRGQRTARPQRWKAVVAGAVCVACAAGTCKIRQSHHNATQISRRRLKGWDGETALSPFG
jgi:hypothetical protein